MDRSHTHTKASFPQRFPCTWQVACPGISAFLLVWSDRRRIETACLKRFIVPSSFAHFTTTALLGVRGTTLLPWRTRPLRSVLIFLGQPTDSLMASCRLLSAVRSVCMIMNTNLPSVTTNQNLASGFLPYEFVDVMGGKLILTAVSVWSAAASSATRPRPCCSRQVSHWKTTM